MFRLAQNKKYTFPPNNKHFSCSCQEKKKTKPKTKHREQSRFSVLRQSMRNNAHFAAC